MRRALALMLSAPFALSASPPPVALDLILGDTLPPKLSDFRFFRELSGLTGYAGGQPSTGVTPYRVNMELYSDGTTKRRFLYLPPGKQLTYSEVGVIGFPVGSVLIKQFGKVEDPRMHVLTLRLIETRLLIRRSTGWVALPYVWDADRRDATLTRAGKRIEVNFGWPGNPQPSISYAVPNVNQCKGCHDAGGQLTPIGPKVRNLNDNRQLQEWHAAGLIDKAPHGAPFMPGMESKSLPLEERARAYLDVNCGHCHSRTGPANTSGLWLNWEQPRDVNYGIRKRPTAAGRGSAGHAFAIDPGHPERSYLISRMQSLDPGIAMPELGRATVHDEGVALISDWIKTLK